MTPMKIRKIKIKKEHNNNEGIIVYEGREIPQSVSNTPKKVQFK